MAGISEKAIWDALKQVYDPELPVNVVDLGLIYNVAVKEDEVYVDMTLTAPGCPMHSYIAQDAARRLQEIPGVKKATVKVVWDPPWNPQMMTEAGKKALGWA